MITLGLDTSTVVCAGVAVDGRVAASGVVADPRAHAEQLMPLVSRVLGEAGCALVDVTGIVVGVGPGPYTGLRVGVVTAVTLAEVLGIGVRGVCSLDGVAAQWAAAGAPDDFAVVADARRKEVYWARYDGAGVRVAGPFVSAPSEMPDLPLAGLGAGPGRPQTLDAGVLALVGHALPDAGLEPLYLRRPDAEVPRAAKPTLAPPRVSPRRRP